MSALRKRHDLPSFVKLSYKFDVDKIRDVIALSPISFNDLYKEDVNSYAEVADKCSCLQETFGLKFKTLEAAYEYLDKTGLKDSSMKWDYRNYIQKVGDKYSFNQNLNPYKQMGLTEFNEDTDCSQFPVKIPSSRIDERKYNKLVSWVKGTYIEEVLNTFQGFVTRVRVARMEPGCVIGEHIDYNTDYGIRVHIPIDTNDNCGFYVKRDKNGSKEELFMKNDGSCWFLNPGFTHSAWNKGKTPRDHLVISLASQEDLDQVLANRA